MSADRAIETWVAQAVSGDVAAVQKLILIYHPRLRAIAAQQMPRALRGKLEPEDVLQQVYVEVVQRAREFENRGPGSFLAWLMRVLESRLIDAQRRFHAAARDVSREAAPREPRSGFEALAVHAALDSLTPSRVIARRETESLLMAALAGLTLEHRRVLELRYLRGLPLSEAAEQMQRSPAAVQMLCGRALRALRAAVGRISAIRP